MKKTEMYIELIVSGFSDKIEEVIKKVPKGYHEYLKKGSTIISKNNTLKMPTIITEQSGRQKTWKENSISYKKECVNLSLQEGILTITPVLKKINSLSLKKASIGIKCVVYMGEDRVDTFLPEKIITTLANNNCYLDIVIY